MKKTTGQKIAAWQKKKGITDTELAGKLDISISYLSRIKRDLRRFSPEKAEDAVNVMGGAIPFREFLQPKAKGQGANRPTS